MDMKNYEIIVPNPKNLRIYRYLTHDYIEFYYVELHENGKIKYRVTVIADIHHGKNKIIEFETRNTRNRHVNLSNETQQTIADEIIRQYLEDDEIEIIERCS